MLEHLWHTMIEIGFTFLTLRPSLSITSKFGGQPCDDQLKLCFESSNSIIVTSSTWFLCIMHRGLHGFSFHRPLGKSLEVLHRYPELPQAFLLCPSAVVSYLRHLILIWAQVLTVRRQNMKRKDEHLIWARNVFFTYVLL